MHGRFAIRTLILLLTFVGFALPAFSAKRVTVALLEQELAADQGRPDAEVARQLSDLELTERLSTARFVRLESDLPGEKARQALMMLADPSSFLDLPTTEIPAAPAPDKFAQQKILALTVNYVTQTMHQLPNFFATRVTTSFEDAPTVRTPGAISAQGLNSATAYQPLHLVDKSSSTVAYRQGHEVLDTIEVKDKTTRTSSRNLRRIAGGFPCARIVARSCAGSSEAASMPRNADRASRSTRRFLPISTVGRRANSICADRGWISKSRSRSARP